MAAMNKASQHLFEFGHFQLDPANHLLLRDGQPVPLPPKAFDTLFLLVQNRGALMEREVLLETVWPDTFVEENNLTHYISMLRKTLGESENENQFIETVPKLGYRFVADVREVGEERGDLLLAKRTKTHIVIRDEEEHEVSAPFEEAADARRIRPFGIFRSRQQWKWLTAFAAVAILLASGLALYLHRPAKLTERDSILLADFENSTGEQVFDDTLRRALAVKLEESPFLNVVTDQQVRDTLRNMGKSPGERLTPSLAREVCQRRGARALLSGSVARLGSQYVIALEAINCATGDALGRAQADAANRDQTVKALGATATELRSKLGESLASIQKFDVPLEEATTSSLEALQAFSVGEKLRAKGLIADAIGFWERAIELDPQFAIAYGRLSGAYVGLGEPDRAREYSRKAFDLRGRCNAREKLILSESYYRTGVGDLEKAVTQLDIWKELYPRDFIPHNNLAALSNDSGQFDRALKEGREAIRLDPNQAVAYNTAGWGALRLNRVEEAKAIFAAAIAQKLDSPMIHRGLYAVAFLQGDSSAMQREAALSSGKADEFRILMFEAQVAAFAGRLRDSRELYRRAAELAQKNHFPDAAGAVLAGSALVEASFGNGRQANERALRSLEVAHGRDGLGIAAAALALSGDLKRAQECINELARAYPSDTLVNAVTLPSARAAMQMRLGNPTKAIESLQEARAYEFGPFVFGQGYLTGFLRGQAYLSLGKGNEAAAEFQNILDHRAAAPFAPLQTLAHLGLARALSSTGKLAESRRAYEELFLLWRDADPDIPVLKQAKAEYAKLG